MGKYLSALWVHWVALMSGIGGLLIGLGLRTGRYFSKTINSWSDIPDWIFICIGLFLLFLSGFLTWKEEHKKVISLSNELEKQKITNFNTNFEVYIAAPAGEKEEDSIVGITAQITNTGAPSILKNIEVLVKVGGKSIKGQPLLTHKEGSHFVGVLDGKPITLSVSYEDHLVRKCLSQPIITGGAVTGLHVVFLPNITNEDVFRVGTVIIFSFQDVFDKTYEFKKIMSGQTTPPLNPMTLQKKYS